MKNIQHIGSNHSAYNRSFRHGQPKRTPKHELLTGSVNNLYPVMLEDGRTVIYISDKSRESEIRLKYAMRK